MKKECTFCQGSGQISYFKGVSRFLLSEEECPECGGLGFTIDETKTKPEAQKAARKKATKSKKKK